MRRFPSRRHSPGVAAGRTAAMWVLALALLAAFLLFLEGKAGPAAVRLAEAEARVLTQEAIQKAVRDRFSDLEYGDLYRVERNSDQYVTFMQPNSGAFNRISAEAVLAVQRNLREIEGESIGIPLGQLLGSRLFAARGPRLPVRVLATAPVEAQIESEFEAAGINQTRHVVELRLRMELLLAAPFQENTIPIDQTVKIAEGIIAGPVPDTFVDFQWGKGTEK